MSNIIIDLQGNLGNVLFQLSHALTYSKRSEKKLYIRCIDSKSEQVFLNSLILKNLNIPKWTKPINSSDIYITENSFNKFIELRTDYPNENVFIEGYFESERYFDSDLIKNTFNFNSIITPELIDKYRIDNDSIALSVRRGDILNLKDIFFIPSKEYYNSVISELVKNNENLIISSDDLEWCKNNIDYQNCSFLQESPEINLALLSLCKNHINSSSTFSWWSSWINEKNDSINIFPYKRFVNTEKQQNDSKIYIPERWIRYKDKKEYYEN